MTETHSFRGSTTLVKASYESERRLLRLWFTSAPQQAYDYPGVPGHIWSGLKLAASAGSYYNEHIRQQYGHQPTPSWQRR